MYGKVHFLGIAIFPRFVMVPDGSQRSGTIKSKLPKKGHFIPIFTNTENFDGSHGSRWFPDGSGNHPPQEQGRWFPGSPMVPVGNQGNREPSLFRVFGTGTSESMVPGTIDRSLRW